MAVLLSTIRAADLRKLRATILRQDEQQVKDLLNSRMRTSSVPLVEAVKSRRAAGRPSAAAS